MTDDRDDQLPRLLGNVLDEPWDAFEPHRPAEPEACCKGHKEQHADEPPTDGLQDPEPVEDTLRPGLVPRSLYHVRARLANAITVCICLSIWAEEHDAADLSSELSRRVAGVAFFVCRLAPAHLVFLGENALTCCDSAKVEGACQDVEDSSDFRSFRVRLPAAWQHSGFVCLAELDTINFRDVERLVCIKLISSQPVAGVRPHVDKGSCGDGEVMRPGAVCRCSFATPADFVDSRKGRAHNLKLRHPEVSVGTISSH
mmetsp:Transcript_68053/g.159581  ORF Transcript_68053/g.159581 Transcript_68053/m.159581 type:complete len:257 (-) Transcript_68053:911-1681(-)